MDRRQRIQNELKALRGMIAEVQAKCRLWKMRAEQEQASLSEPSEEFSAGVDEAVRQMKRDLAKYRRRSQYLLEQWRQYGEVS